MSSILHMLLLLPLFSAGTLLTLLAFSLLWLGLHGVMGWLLDLSTTWVPQRAWTVWQGFHPLVIWEHGLQTSRPLLLAFHGSSDFMARVCLGMAGLSTVVSWTFIALHLALSWLAVGTIGITSGCRMVFNDNRALHPKTVAVLLDLLVFGLFVGFMMPMFLAMPHPDSLTGHMAATLSVLVLALLIDALSRFIWSSFDSSVDSPRMLED
jgi:hypothetical protein